MKSKELDMMKRQIIMVDSMMRPIKKTGVVFHEFIDDGEDMFDHYFGDVMTVPIVGLEQKDGTVVVYKDQKKLDRPLRNKKIFIDKYFIEAL